ncbi:hypothetical protein TNCV_103161 [Trichonephila clavipes]|nr:hypothetical protein TNCV_103161 [Trichonephila clavipes]
MNAIPSANEDLLCRGADLSAVAHSSRRCAKPVLKESCRLGWCRENGIIETGGVMDKCVQKLVKELWCLALDGPGYEEKALPSIERTWEDIPGWNRLEESPGWKELEESAKERDLVRDWSGKEGKTMSIGGVE